MTRVLIVDDQSVFRLYLRRLLTLAGLTVVGEANDMAEAETLLACVFPDLVVMEVMLPGLDGISGAAQLKTLAPDLRVILVSAYQDQAALFESAALAVGAEAFVAKDALDLNVVRAWRRNDSTP